MIRGGSVVLNVSDLGRAVRFYVETLGMKLVEESEAAALLDAGDGFLLGLTSGSAPGGSGLAVVFHVKVPLAEAIAIYENRGVSFTTEKSSRGLVARFRDPDANLLGLAERPS